MKKTILTGLLLAAISFTSCEKEDVKPASTFTLVVDNLQGDIKDGTVTLDASKTYKLTGALVVRSGATLNIPAGTRIEAIGDNPNTLYIAVERGAKIFIKGEENKAVVMTSGKATKTQSDWGGLIICGDGKVNTGDNGTSEVGGLAYGGNNNADSSGEINFLRIEYTGSKFTPEKEYNGVSFFGVGSGTKVSNIYAFESGDDGIDFADGWAGTGEFWYVSGAAKAGIEGSNNGENGDKTPVTNATLKNITVVGPVTEGALYFKEGGGNFTVDNFYIDGVNLGVKVKSSDAPAIARIVAGKLKMTNVQFANKANGFATTDYAAGSASFLTEVTTATGAGNKAATPTWATGWARF